MATDRIKRAITWIRKTLEITEKTTLPAEILGEIRPTLDAFGWEKYGDAVNANFSIVNSALISSSVVPENTFRLITEASIHANSALAFTFWIELVHSTPTALRIGLTRPFLMPAASANVPVALERPILLGPGDSLRGNSLPTTGVGEILVLRTRSIDLTIGEYMPAV